MNRRSVTVNPDSGEALLQATNLPMADYHDFVSSVTGGPAEPGVVSFRVEWAPSTDKHDYRHEAHRWAGTFVQTTATCTWSGRTKLAEFSTDTNDATIFAEVGHERSGVFFS